uniref:Secreted protein n=1 Tax=Oryza barthii TaxID=65489 RepID=A0A0D3HLA2_9ORYZ
MGIGVLALLSSVQEAAAAAQPRSAATGGCAGGTKWAPTTTGGDGGRQPRTTKSAGGELSVELRARHGDQRRGPAVRYGGEEATVEEPKQVEPLPLLWIGAEIIAVFPRVLLPLQPCRIRDGAIRASFASTSGGQRPDELPAAHSRSCPTRGRNVRTVVGSTGSGSGRSPH